MTKKAKTGKVNSELAKLVRNRYFESLGAGLSEVAGVLKRNGFSVEGLDGIYCGNGRITEGVGLGRYLTLTWHRMEATGNFEIVAYIS